MMRSGDTAVVVVNAESAWTVASLSSDLDRQLVFRESPWERCCCRDGADRFTWHANDRVDAPKLDLEVDRLKAGLGEAGPGVPDAVLSDNLATCLNLAFRPS